MSQLKDRYRELVVGEVSCFDRVVINGTLTEICHKGAMAQYLLSRGQRILDLPRVFEPLQNCGRQALEPWNVRSFQLSKVLKPGTETDARWALLVPSNRHRSNDAAHKTSAREQIT